MMSVYLPGQRMANPFSRKIVAFLVTFSLLIGILILPQKWAPFMPKAEAAGSQNLVISQVYGGGGNSGATYQNDFIEIFNRGNSAASLNGLSLQYASATGTGNFGVANQITVLPNVSVQSGKYYLVKEAGGATGAVLPTPDLNVTTGAINLGGTAGKIALVNSTTSLGCNGSSAPCDAAATAKIIDLVGYGTGSGGANFFEGTSAAPTLGNALAALRGGNGCVDTDQNGSDFIAATPAPRNSATNAQGCGTGNLAPVINTPANPISTVTQDAAAFTVNLSGSDDGGLYTWSATAGTGISSVAVTAGQGTPNVTYAVALQSGFTGTATFTASLSDGVNAAVTQLVNIKVNPPPTPTPSATPTPTPNNPPVITTPANPIVTVAQDAAPFSVGLTGSDDNNAFSWSATAGSGVSSVSVTGGQGTPNATYTVALTPGFSGTATFTAELSDGVNGTVSKAVNITVTPPVLSSTVAISQVYGGGGNTGSTLKNDYIELINRGSSAVNLNGWSVQAYVTPQSGTAGWQTTPLPNFTLQPGQYFLVQESQGAGGTDNLPSPDAVGTIAVSSTSTRVALVSNTTLLTADCPSGPGIVDLVGYGTSAGCFEGSGAAPQLSNTTAATRLNEGCFDTDDNATDFVSGPPAPRNSSSATHDCTGISGFGSSDPASILQGQSSTLTVHVAAGQNPPSTGISVTGDLTSIGGSATQAFVGSGSSFSFMATVPLDNSPGLKSLPITIRDSEGHSFITNIQLSILPVIPNHIVISQIYGGGGNSGATYHNDFVELYNPTSAAVDTGGWTIQYASSTGTFTQVQPLGGVIQPGEYYLIALASGGANGAALPLANVVGSINMSGTTGKVALSNAGDGYLSGCPIGDPSLVDFVGYGTGADCREGGITSAANAPAPSNTTADFRKNGGLTDTNVNSFDFVAAAPNPRRTAVITEIGPYVLNVDPRSNSADAPHDDTITVNFTEAVDVDNSWYDISCAASGSHNDATIAHTGDFKSYAITPNVNFQFGEVCTATVFQTAVHDQDTDDSAPGTDMLKANYSWSFTVVGAGQPAPYDPGVHLTMGDPGCNSAAGCASSSVGTPNNFLMTKPTYSLSYNRDKGTPNWVSWHLDNSWYGTLSRVDTFRADPAVPADWYRVEGFDYSGSGFDRGHMTPNADRDNQFRVPINQETYLMSNMVPQAPDNNQGPWAALEAYLRTLADTGSEIYIVSGPAGTGGQGTTNGPIINTIANGHVIVPAYTWKVALVLPKGDNDVSRVTCTTPTIAVVMPNVQGIRNNDWHNYLTTVSAVQQLTGYDFFSNLPKGIQGCVEAGMNGTNPPGASDGTFAGPEDSNLSVTLTALPVSNTAISYSVVNGPAHGSLTGTGANRTYTPAPNYNGTDSFTYTVTQDGKTSPAATISLNVSEVNDAVSAVDDNRSTDEDTPLNFASGDLTINDSAGPAEESDSQTLTVQSVTGNADTHGSVSLAGGQITYSPDANYNGAASFGYHVCDNGTTAGVLDPQCADATVHVTVNSVNDVPIAVADSANTDEDTAVQIAVLTNDTDADGDPLSVTTVTQGGHGSVSKNAGVLTYTPAADYNGPDSFTYTVSDSKGGSAVGTVDVNVAAVNDAPVAASQSVATDEDTPRNITLGATDVDSGSLTFTTTAPEHGTLSGSGAGLTYTPAADYNGSDSFTFTANDGTATSNTATVSITVSPSNDAPIANAQSVSTNEDTPTAIVLSGSDVETPAGNLVFNVTQAPAHGLLSGTGSNVTYTPAANYNGADSFKFTVSDTADGSSPSLTSSEATVAITVTPVNDAPVAVTDSPFTAEDNSVNITVLANDTDVDGDALAVTSFTQGSHGTVSQVGNVLTYSPDTNYFGVDSFTYTVSDGHGGTAPGTVNVGIASVNDTPVASNDQPTNYPSVQYSDGIQPITVTASDVETSASQFAITYSTSRNGTFLKAALPDGLSLTQGPSNTWSLAGNITEGAGTYAVTITFTDGNGAAAGTTVTLVVATENAAVAVPPTPPVRTASAGGSSGAFNLTANITEIADRAAGSIANAAPVTFTLTPVGAGTPFTCSTASYVVNGSTEQASCTFSGINVNVYNVTVNVGGDHYAGSGSSMISVFDPSLGFVSGSGSANGSAFSTNVKYSKDGVLQASLTFGGLQATSFESMAIVGSEAIVTGKATVNGVAGYSFTARFADNGEPGVNDRVGMSVTDPSGNAVSNLTFAPVKITNGNIQFHN